MLSYTSSKADYSVGENIYMLPSNMNLNIRSGTSRYNNKILVSDGKFNLGKCDEVNALALEPVISRPSHKVVAPALKSCKAVTATQMQKTTITYKEEKIALILSLTGAFTVWCLF